MALVNYTRGVDLVLKVGDGASPEVFTALCTINADRSLTFNAQMTDEVIPDCADPGAVAWLVREAESLSIEFSGGGMLDKANVKTLWDWWKSGAAKNCQVILDDDVAANVITFEGAFKLANFDHSGSRSQKVAATMSLASDGEVEATFGANVGGS